ncbi:hypothetical protein BT63DRAFT_321328 [Microthyrium microscopicum]|uniref:Rhodopsin domain-containing protein n=1 Tax=Microthyrium microscopicum TaxID=703497 RepID=A0A6A6U7C5_9PEZI|nr:hypothetical protein BT63DRAFT_321328 [Microthyrium microscopicum]
MGLPLVVESWIWYSICTLVVIFRIISRTLHVKSILRLQIDDWMIIVALASHTAFIAAINKESHYSSNLIAPGENVNTFSAAERASRIYGSKLTVVVEQLQCLTVWLVKSCLVILYYRLTKSLRLNKFVIALGVYVLVGFIVMEILYFGVWCRPFHNYWALPTPSKQCDAATNHLITNAVFNISSDVIMLCIAFSLFVGNNLAWNRKLILGGVFGLGIFSILSAVLNKYYSFTHPFGSQWTFWYVRESSTALIVANIPFTWTLLRRMFKLGAFHNDDTVSTIKYHSQRSARGRTAPKIAPGNGTRKTNSHSHSHTSSDLNSPTRTRHPSLSVDVSKAKNWRQQGVYGREDADALGIDPWDFGNEGIEPVEGETKSDNVSIAHTDASPKSQRARRLRDEEAQSSMQASLSPTYHDFLQMLHDENEPNHLHDVHEKEEESEAAREAEPV